MKKIIVLILVAASVFSANLSADFIRGIRAQSLGGAYRAIATGNDAIYFNPAGLALVERYNPRIDYTYGFAGPTHNVDISIVDSSTSKLAAGIAYNLGIQSVNNASELTHLASLVLAYPIWPDVMFLGTTLKYVNAYEASGRLSRVTMDAGLAFILPLGLTLGASVENFIPSESALVPMNFGVGTAFNIGGGHLDTGSMVDKRRIGKQHGEFGGFTVSTDWVMKDLLKESGTMHNFLDVGASYLIADAFPIRVGYEWGQTDATHSVAAGLGFMLEIFSLEVFFRQNITHTEERFLGLMFDFYL